MKRFAVLYSKELLEMWRNYKIVWVPLAFIMLGLSQPITAYYQPDILKMAGITKEAIALLPQPNEMEVVAKTLSQFNLLGTLILVLAGMSIIAGERQSGVAAMVFIKPVSYTHYILGKWLGYLTLVFISITLGFLASCYYTDLLIGNIDYNKILEALPVYLLWFIFIISVTILIGSILEAPSAIAFLSIAIISILSIVTTTLPKMMEWSPAKLSTYATQLIINGETTHSMILTLISTMLLVLACIVLAIFSYKQKPLLK